MRFRSLCRSLGALAALAAAPGAAAEDAVTVAITKADCARLVRHVPAPDATYQPGIDVYGQPVVGADAEPVQRIELPDEYVFEIEIRPFDFGRRRRLQIEPAAPAERSSAAASESEDGKRDLADLDRRGIAATTLSLGTARVSPDGRAYFNDQPLHDEALADLAERCRELLAAGR